MHVTHATKVRARKAIRLAVRQGRVIAGMICEHCQNAIATDAHHEDYSKPLDVMWLCRGCHKSQYHQGDL